MTTTNDALSSLDQTLQTGWKSDAQNILLDNAAIFTSQVWEQNQKSYNQIWLEMIVNDQEGPDLMQTNTLLSIAYQCPYAGGEAVYQARALLSEDLVYDDPMLCIGGSQQLIKQGSEPDLSFTAYPNPGKDYVVVELEQDADGQGVLTLSDILGRAVWTQAIAEGDQQVFLMLGAVPAGLYHLTVNLNGQTVTRAFSIVK